MASTGVFETLWETLKPASVDPTELLNPTNVRMAQQEFLERPELTTPHFVHGRYDKAFLAQTKEILDRVNEELLKQAEALSPLQRSFLRLQWDYDYRAYWFLYYSLRIQQEGAQDPELREAHQQANRNLYGQPDWQIFCLLLKAKLDELLSQVSTPQEQADAITLQRELLSLVTDRPCPATTGTSGDQFKPRTETVLKFGDIMREHLKNFLQHVPENQEPFNMVEACQIVDEMLRAELPKTRYHAEMQQDATTISVLHDKHIVRFPVYRPKGDLSYQDMRAIVVGHELGVHTFRAVPYEGTPFGQMWPDAEQFDEGLACCVEDALKGKYTQRGVYHYLSVSLARFYGMNFRQVFELIRRLRRLDEVPPGRDREDFATGQAFLETRRCFRGTGVLPVCKDLMYYHGTAKSWRFIEEHLQDPDELLHWLFSAGKSDPTNPQHRAEVMLLWHDFH